MTSDFLSTVAAFEAAVDTGDGEAALSALDRFREVFGDATDAEAALAGPRLAAALPAVPAGPAGLLGILVGACVERGADPVACAPAVLDKAETAVAAAAEFCRRWPGEQDLPEPTLADPPAAVVAAVGGADDPVARGAALGWWTLPLWERAAGAVLSHEEVRRAELPRPVLTDVLAEVHAASGAGQWLLSALKVLDDERLVVVHRPSGKGFEMTMGGIGDNFQLHTLLAATLVPDHLPGARPDAAAIAACTGADPQASTEYAGAGVFNLVAPDGTWIWNEGTPSDIPVTEGVRLLLLDPPPYQRTWTAGRLFPGMRAHLTLERTLSEAEVAEHLTTVRGHG